VVPLEVPRTSRGAHQTGERPFSHPEEDHMNVPLPGFVPGLIRIELRNEGDEGWSVRVTEAQDERFVSAADTTTYGGCSLAEALDVAEATLAALEPF
jgi:hypothetical protein